MGGLRGSRGRSLYRLALSPACWGVSDAGDWGHQIDAERVLSEAAAVGEGAITAGPPRFLPDRSDQAKRLLRRHRLKVVAGQVHPIEVVELTAGRIQHVHLNDVDLDLGRRVRDRSLDYVEAVGRNLYRPVGEGGADVTRVMEALRSAGYQGWYTLEQETRLATVQDRPLGRVSRSLEFLLPLLA